MLRRLLSLFHHHHRHNHHPRHADNWRPVSHVPDVGLGEY